MTAALTIDVGRRAPLGRDELRRRMLALVLAFVLVWYTFVVPAGAASAGPRRYAPDDEGHDGEVRRAGGAAAEKGPPAADDLDWPEYIYP